VTPGSQKHTPGRFFTTPSGWDAFCRVTAVALVAVFCAGCSDDTASPPANEPPTIQLTLNGWATTKVATVTLTALVSDPDEDPVTVTWEVFRDGQPSGTLNSHDQGQPSMRWTAPVTLGRDSIVATASDGKGGTAKATDTILVGTLRSTSSVSGEQTWYESGSPYVIRPGGISFVVNERSMLTIESGVERRVRLSGGARSRDPFGPQDIASDSQREAKHRKHLTEFYRSLIDVLRDVEALYLLGPGSAKNELRREIERIKPLCERIVAVDTTDKMTDRQIAAAVRAFFGRHQKG